MSIFAVIYQTLIAPFTLPFMAHALWLGLFAGFICAILSCFIVFKGWSLIGDALSHAVLPGIVIAYLVDLPLALGAIVSGMACVTLAHWLEDKSKIKADTLVGIAFTTFLALGLVLVTAVPSNINFVNIMLGNLLGIDIATRWQLLICGTLALILLLLKFSDLRLYCFDAVQAQMVGIEIKRLRFLLLTILALTTVAVLQTVGMILAIAMLVTPGCVGFLLTKRFLYLVIVAIITSLVSVWWGLAFSFAINAEAGGCIVIVQFVLFLTSSLITPRRRLIAQFISKIKATP